MKTGSLTITNRQWYPYEALGNFFRLVGGVLLAVPMLKDGSMDMDGDTPNAVEVILTIGTARIVADLRTKP